MSSSSSSSGGGGGGGGGEDSSLSPAANKVMIMGYDVVFPAGKRPFPAQLAVMNKVLLALKTSQHALLESPTGSGKTLALLCSSLTFQRRHVRDLLDQEEQQQRLKQQQQQQTQQHKPPKPDPSVEKRPPVAHDDDEDFASTQPTFERFRLAPQPRPHDDHQENDTDNDQVKDNDNDDDENGGGWISMADKRTKRPAASSRRNVDPNVDDAVGAPQPQPPPTKKRRLPSSFGALALVTDGGGSLEDFHATATGSTKAPRRVTPPKIFFCSRTHSQLAQVIDELKNCPGAYLESPDLANAFSNQLKTCVLGSKAHFCVNRKVNRDPGELDDKCRAALEANTCGFFRKRKKTNDLRRVVPAVWDIEDVVALARQHRECAFFHAREALVDAHIVFCPYNYLLDPTIREAVGISLKNAIIVLDEAHNVEDTCRASASLEVTTDTLAMAIGSFADVIKHGHRPPAYLGLLKILNGCHRWLKNIAASSATILRPTGYEEESRVWTGMECIAMFAEYTGMTQETIDTLRRDLRAVAEYEKELTNDQGPGARGAEGEEEEGDGHRLSAVALGTIRGILNVAEYMYRDGLKYLDDFKLIVRKSRARQRRQGRHGYGSSQTIGNDSWELKMCIWCLNAAVAFSDVVREARSVILTSGTLSPMDSFAGELGTDFPIRLEANHVVNIRQQVFIGAVMHGPGNVDLSATYKNQQEFRYQDSMGELLFEYAQVVPGGVLMFFPSYSLMDKLATRWRQTGTWAKIEQLKVLFSEPRNAGKDFDALLDEYKQTNETSTTNAGPKTGAIFLAVYRGKVSEGIDFSNANARAVLAVGIPYPSVKELQVELKRKYQDEKSAIDRKLVTGSSWYQLQAFRALNQALGRCIRHRQDYGAIILVDSRYRFQAHTKSLSKWIRPFVREFEHAQECVPLLGPFFEQNMRTFGTGVTVPTVNTPAETGVQAPLKLKYEVDTDVASLSKTKDTVRAYLDMKRQRAAEEPKVFSIFQPRSTPQPSKNVKSGGTWRR